MKLSVDIEKFDHLGTTKKQLKLLKEAVLTTLLLSAPLNQAKAQTPPQNPDPKQKVEQKAPQQSKETDKTAVKSLTPEDFQKSDGEKKEEVKTIEIQKMTDYITQAPAKLKQYYPEEEAYFQKIFEVMKNAGPGIANIANLKLEEQFNEYAEDFTDEKDRWTAVFMFCELAYPATEFTKKKEKLDEFDLDMRQVVATEALRKMTLHFAREEKKANEINAKSKEDLGKTKKKGEELEKKGEELEKKGEELEKKGEELEKKGEEVQKKLKELEKVGKRVNQQREQTIQGTERLMEEIDPQSVKTVIQVQEMVRYYEKICKENGRKPTKKAQELINQLPEKQKKK